MASWSNSIANLRSGLGMGTTVPSDAAITVWQTLVDNLIEGYNSSPNIKNAPVIEYNRIGDIFNQTRKKTGDDKWKVNTGIIKPLTEKEQEQLNQEENISDSGIDLIPINGKRWNESY